MIVTMDDCNFSGKTVLVRVDLNLPYYRETNEYGHSKRLVEHAKTIKELSDKGAKVVILAHQGRPGREDFRRLAGHAAVIYKYVGKPVNYVDDIFGTKAIEKIKSLNNSEILLLENVRFLAEEQMDCRGESIFVKTLAPLIDLFVMDAFSSAHRSHVSMIGFQKLVPSVVGRVMQKEVDATTKAISRVEHPSIFVVGGDKPDDCLEAIKNLMEKNSVDRVLVGGIIGHLFLKAAGYNLGEATERHLPVEHLDSIKEVLEKYKNKIELPIDVAYEDDGKRNEILVENLPATGRILDIGSKTADHYSNLILKAKTINIKGPVGMYEHAAFALGTKMIMTTIAESDGFSLIGGGHTLQTLKELELDEEKFSHVTLGGGAFLTMLCGKPLPALKALEEGKKP